MQQLVRFIDNPFAAIREWLNGLLTLFLPEWIVYILLAALGILVIVSLVGLLVMVMVFLERRIIARIQDRIGPNRVGPNGTLQLIADTLKLISKEDVVPARADRLLHALAPIVVLGASFMVWAVIPWGPGIVPTDLNVGVLYVIAMGGVPTIGFVMAGWASHNKYSLLGGMRAAAQFISYEIPGALAVVTPVLLAGSMSLGDIVEAQSGYRWFIFYPIVGQVAFLLFLIAGVAEANRTPFDIIEAESEIIAGFHTEYSGMRWALFMMTEYANLFAISCIGVVLFAGGWEGPVLPPYLWFFIKAWVLVFVFFWLRGTLPRLRFDQLMHFAWKRLIPVALTNIGLSGLGVSLGVFQTIFAR